MSQGLGEHVTRGGSWQWSKRGREGNEAQRARDADAYLTNGHDNSNISTIDLNSQASSEEHNIAFDAIHREFDYAYADERGPAQRHAWVEDDRHVQEDLRRNVGDVIDEAPWARKPGTGSTHVDDNRAMFQRRTRSRSAGSVDSIPAGEYLLHHIGEDGDIGGVSGTWGTAARRGDEQPYGKCVKRAQVFAGGLHVGSGPSVYSGEESYDRGRPAHGAAEAHAARGHHHKEMSAQAGSHQTRAPRDAAAVRGKNSNFDERISEVCAYVRARCILSHPALRCNHGIILALDQRMLPARETCKLPLPDANSSYVQAHMHGRCPPRRHVL